MNISMFMGDLSGNKLSLFSMKLKRIRYMHFLKVWLLMSKIDKKWYFKKIKWLMTFLKFQFIGAV